MSVNPTAVEDLLGKAGLSKADLCAASGITSGHLADMLHRGKGASRPVVLAMATCLRCSPETIAPQLSRRFAPVRLIDHDSDLPTREWLAQTIGAEAVSA